VKQIVLLGALGALLNRFQYLARLRISNDNTSTILDRFLGWTFARYEVV
jgi:hypothetical protein